MKCPLTGKPLLFMGFWPDTDSNMYYCSDCDIITAVHVPSGRQKQYEVRV